MNTKDIEEMRKQKFYQYLQVAGFHKEFEEWLTTLTEHHEAEVERITDHLFNVHHCNCDLSAPTKTDKQTDV